MCRRNDGRFRIPRNNELMIELNDMMIRMKVHLYYSDNRKMCEYHLKPICDELDLLQSKINQILDCD